MKGKSIININTLGLQEIQVVLVYFVLLIVKVLLFHILALRYVVVDSTVPTFMNVFVFISWVSLLLRPAVN